MKIKTETKYSKRNTDIDNFLNSFEKLSVKSKNKVTNAKHNKNLFSIAEWGGGKNEIYGLINSLTIDELIEKNAFGKTPLFVACEHGQYDVIIALLERLGYVALNNDKYLLHAAIFNGKMSVINLLLKHLTHEKISEKDEYNCTPLHVACTYVSFDHTNSIIEKLIDVYDDEQLASADMNGKTCLHLLVINSGSYQESYKQDMMIKILKRINISNFVTNDGDTIMHIACKNGSVNAVNLLLNWMDIRMLCIHNAKGNNIMHELCYNKRYYNDDVTSLVSIAKSLLNYVEYNTFDKKNSNGDTPFMLACENDYIEIVKVFLNKIKPFSENITQIRLIMEKYQKYNYHEKKKQIIIDAINGHLYLYASKSAGYSTSLDCECNHENNNNNNRLKYNNGLHDVNDDYDDGLMCDE
jgi:ankyrin repeat protein